MERQAGGVLIQDGRAPVVAGAQVKTTTAHLAAEYLLAQVEPRHQYGHVLAIERAQMGGPAGGSNRELELLNLLAPSAPNSRSHVTGPGLPHRGVALRVGVS